MCNSPKRLLTLPRTHLQHQLPGRGPVVLHAQLLQGRQPGHRAVLPADPAGQEGLHPDHEEPDADCGLSLRVPEGPRFRNNVAGIWRRASSRGIPVSAILPVFRNVLGCINLGPVAGD